MKPLTAHQTGKEVIMSKATMSEATHKVGIALCTAVLFFLCILILVAVVIPTKTSHKPESEEKTAVTPTAIYTAKPGDLVEEKGCWNYITSNGLDSTNSVSQIRIKPLCGGEPFPVYQYNLANVSEVISFEKNRERWIEIVHQQLSE